MTFGKNIGSSGGSRSCFPRPPSTPTQPRPRSKCAATLRSKRHWIVSPDGALAMLPFETLTLDGKTAIAAHDLSYVQSLSMLALLIQRDADYRTLGGRKTLFAMGGAQYEAAGDAATRGKRGTAVRAGVDLGAYLSRNSRDARAVNRNAAFVQYRDIDPAKVECVAGCPDDSANTRVMKIQLADRFGDAGRV